MKIGINNNDAWTQTICEIITFDEEGKPIFGEVLAVIYDKSFAEKMVEIWNIRQ